MQTFLYHGFQQSMVPRQALQELRIEPAVALVSQFSRRIRVPVPRLLERAKVGQHLLPYRNRCVVLPAESRVVLLWFCKSHQGFVW